MSYLVNWVDWLLSKIDETIGDGIQIIWRVWSLQSYLEELKKEGYRVNKMLNGYIAYLKKRKAEGPD